MNLLDLFILLPIGYCTYKGYVNGFLREFFSLVGIFVAIFVTFKYMGSIADFMAYFVDNKDTATIIAGIALFIVTLIAVQAAVTWLEKILHLINLGILNKLAGLLFGAAKSAIFVSAILLLLAGINIPSENNRTQSSTYSYVIYAAPMAFNMLAKLYPGAEDFIDTIERNLQENNTLRTLPIFEKTE